MNKSHSSTQNISASLGIHLQKLHFWPISLISTGYIIVPKCAIIMFKCAIIVPKCAINGSCTNFYFLTLHQLNFSINQPASTLVVLYNDQILVHTVTLLSRQTEVPAITTCTWNRNIINTALTCSIKDRFRFSTSGFLDKFDSERDKANITKNFRELSLKIVITTGHHK